VCRPINRPRADAAIYIAARRLTSSRAIPPRTSSRASTPVTARSRG